MGFVLKIAIGVFLGILILSSLSIVSPTKATLRATAEGYSEWRDLTPEQSLCVDRFVSKKYSPWYRVKRVYIVTLKRTEIERFWLWIQQGVKECTGEAPKDTVYNL